MLKLDLNRAPEPTEELLQAQAAAASHSSPVYSTEKNQMVAGIIGRIGTHAMRGTHVRSDSRAVQKGDVFLAYPFDPLAAEAQSSSQDGRNFVEQAYTQGARAVLWHRDERTPPQMNLPIGVVADLNQNAGYVASAYYSYPSEQMLMVAVTGTNGKTSCAQWIAQMFERLERRCGLMGTLGVGFLGAMQETGFTTPQAVEVQRNLHQLHNAGAQATVMEVSSHALVQGRVNAVAFEVALFTNLSRDHLDYHQTLEAYEQAKSQLFNWPSLKSAVINTDDQVGQRLAQLASQRGIRVIGYGFESHNQHCTEYVLGSQLIQSGQGTQMVVSVLDEQLLQQPLKGDDDAPPHWTVQTSLVGQFNAMNVLGVLGVCMAAGHSLDVCAAMCSELEAAPGRMQRFGGQAQALVVVDFAHTPDALAQTLQALRPIALQRGGQLHCVFGCGGDRDAGKRGQMGAVAQVNADTVCVTSDNPRTELPEQIIQEICAGMNAEVANYQVEVNRAKAIKMVIGQAQAHDVVLVAGKGHELYQDIMGIKHPYSDIEEVGRALADGSAQPNEVQTRHSGRTINAGMCLLSEAAQWVGALETTGAAQFKGVSTDTRNLSAQNLFIALAGERYDAHNFLAQLEVGQVAAVMAERVPENFKLPYIIVKNTRTALQQLAQHWRIHFTMPVAVVTGSNGKTTVKEMLASILQSAFGEAYLATRGNLNNDIGLPLTLMNLQDNHAAAVIELGMNHPGETRQLAPIVQPNVAIINNAQREHQEFMQTVEAVAQEHADVIDSVQAGGAVVFPADDAYARIWRERAQKRNLTVHDFSMNECEPAAYSARYELGLYASTVQLMTPKGQCTTQINIPGAHNVHNALAACAAATAMGIELETIARGLSEFVPAKGRLQTHKLAEDVILIDDTYNANPDSVRAAIDVLANGAGKKVLVLGDMGEVGADGAVYHAEIGAYAQQKNIDLLLVTGDMMHHAAQAFGAGAQHFNEVAGIADVVRAHLQTGPNTILVKGSRFMGMERVVQALLDGKDEHTQKDAGDAT